MRKKGCIGKCREEIKAINIKLKELYPSYQFVIKLIKRKNILDKKDFLIIAEYNYLQGNKKGIEIVIGWLTFKEEKYKGGKCKWCDSTNGKWNSIYDWFCFDCGKVTVD